MMPVALTIAGSDPSGGAGIQADLKTFHQRGVYGMGVITLLTVQNTTGIGEILAIGSEVVGRQIDFVIEDIPPHAIKIGALAHQKIVTEVSKKIKNLAVPIILDPVMLSQNQAPLLIEEAVEILKKDLIPHATLVTPNLHEAQVLSGLEVRDVQSMEKAAKKISELGPEAVLIKGGHLEGENAVDVLYWKKEFEVFSVPKIKVPPLHGTGCTYSAAITAELAKDNNLLNAVRIAKEFVTEAIRNHPDLGKGSPPLNHFVNPSD